MAYDVRRSFTLDAATDAILRDCADRQGCSDSEMLRRMVLVWQSIVDELERLPRDEQGRTQRIVLLPDSADPPPGWPVLRLYVTSLPRPPATTPEPVP